MGLCASRVVTRDWLEARIVPRSSAEVVKGEVEFFCSEKSSEGCYAVVAHESFELSAKIVALYPVHLHMRVSEYLCKS